MDDLDLDLNNYELDDILNLFKLDYNFDETALKQAKKIVLQTHPDKSKLPKEYFLFFSKAYKIVYQVYTFRHHPQQQNTEYTVEEKDETQENLLGTMKEKKNFNELFNEMFEKNKLHDDDKDGGYGDWLKSNDDVDMRQLSFNEMKDVMDEKREKLKSLVVHKDIEEAGNMNHYDLSRDKPEEYSADIFSTLHYEDLKKAHTETVVPVTHEDYLNRKKFSNENEMRSFRDNQDINPLPLGKAQSYNATKEKIQTEEDIRRAYKLAKQDEVVRDINDKWWGQLKRISQ